MQGQSGFPKSPSPPHCSPAKAEVLVASPALPKQIPTPAGKQKMLQLHLRHVFTPTLHLEGVNTELGPEEPSCLAVTQPMRCP